MALHGTDDEPVAGQANVAWAVGKLSHFHQGLLDAMAKHAISMVKVCALALVRVAVALTAAGAAAALKQLDPMSLQI